MVLSLPTNTTLQAKEMNQFNESLNTLQPYCAGERTWASKDLRVSILCLMWLAADEPELLVSGGGDQRLRVWRQEEEAGMVLLGCFGVQQGPILALAQNSSYLASASGQTKNLNTH